MRSSGFYVQKVIYFFRKFGLYRKIGTYSSQIFLSDVEYRLGGKLSSGVIHDDVEASQSGHCLFYNLS